jgi:uncharacterized protein (TIGR03083 family)
MAIATVELQRLLGVVDLLDDHDWTSPTDCEGWDVKALLSHALGAMEGNARAREFVRQFRHAMRAARTSGRPMIDEMTAQQIRDHAGLAPAQIAAQLHAIGPRAVRGRRRTLAPVRAMPFKPGPPIDGSWTVGYLLDVIMNRDFWMHRVDLIRATGKELVLTPDHDGRIVADVVAEWARSHGQPFTLVLEGPAGGMYVRGDGGEHHQLDAVELCRILSGRAAGAGLLEQEVPF